MRPSVGKGGRGGGNEHNSGSCRPVVRTQAPNEDVFGAEVSEKRAEVAEVNTLLAVGRCLHQQGRLQVGAKVEEVNIV